jgi:hypothetical protein
MRRQREDGYEVSDDPARLDLDTIHGFLRTAYWSPGVTRETVDSSVAGSLPMGLYAPDGAQAGYARAVTDRATFGYLADVFVLRTPRPRLSWFLVRCAGAPDPPRRGGCWPPRTPTASTRLGFTPADDPDRWMVRGPRSQVSGDGQA